MPPRRPRLLSAFAAALALALGQQRAPAQVPVGTAVVGTASGPASSGQAGLFLVSSPSGTVVPVTGLPAHLRPIGATPTQQGVGSVAYRSSDGAIVVGTVAASGGPTAGVVELYLFYLNGSAVDPMRTRQVVLGTAAVGTAGAFVAVLPDDRIFVIAGPLTSGPMAATGVAIVDVPTNPATAPTITLLPTPAVIGGGGGIAIDSRDGVVWLASNVNPGQPTMRVELFRWDWKSNALCLVATLPGEVANGLVCDDGDVLYVSSSTLATASHQIHTVYVNGCGTPIVTTVPSTVSIGPSGLALDRASHRLVVPSAQFAPGFAPALLSTLFLVDPSTGVAAPIAGGPTAWGAMGRSAVAMHNAVESYGQCTDGLGHHWFDTFPNAGGQPTVGNAGFTLTMRSSSAAPALSFVALSSGRGFTNALGIDVMIDLNSTVLLPWVLPTGLTTTMPLPIPNDPALAGGVAHLQAAHLESNGGFAATRGLTLVVQ